MTSSRRTFDRRSIQDSRGRPARLGGRRCRIRISDNAIPQNHLSSSHLGRFRDGLVHQRSREQSVPALPHQSRQSINTLTAASVRAVRYRALPELCPTCESAEPIRTSEYLGESCYLCPDCNLVWTRCRPGPAVLGCHDRALGHSKDSKTHHHDRAVREAHNPARDEETLAASFDWPHGFSYVRTSRTDERRALSRTSVGQMSENPLFFLNCHRPENLDSPDFRERFSLPPLPPLLDTQRSLSLRVRP